MWPELRLEAHNGAVRAGDGRSIAYEELVTGEALHVKAEPQSPIARIRKKRTVMGQPMQRIDIPAKVTGGVAYVSRSAVARNGACQGSSASPSHGARLKTLRIGDVERMAGFLKLVRDGSFRCGSLPRREYEAIRARCARLPRAPAGDEKTSVFPAQADLYRYLRRLPSQDTIIFGNASAPNIGPGMIEASYHRPYQMHAAIGPSLRRWAVPGRTADGLDAQPRRLIRCVARSRKCCASRRIACGAFTWKVSGCYGA